jgi:hypothetical protein
MTGTAFGGLFPERIGTLPIISVASATSTRYARPLFPVGRQLFQNPAGDSALWFDSDAIIDRRPNPLLAAKVSLGRLNRDMS